MENQSLEIADVEDGDYVCDWEQFTIFNLNAVNDITSCESIQINKLQMTVALNVECDNELCEMEQTVSDKLENVRAELKNIEAQIKDIDKKGTNSLKDKVCSFDPSGQFFSSPPPNQDTVDKNKNGYFSYLDLPSTRLWKADEISKLENSIRVSEIEARIKEMRKVEKAVMVQLTKCEDPAMKDNLELKLEKCRFFCNAIKHMELKDLVACSKVTEYDWLKIAVIDLSGMRTDNECRLMWWNYLHPNINKGEWTKIEDTELQALAEKYKYQDWDAIAIELGTNRTPFQCACRYHRYLNKNMRNSKWTTEDDKALRHCIQKFQIGNYIPWQKVAYHMEDRTKLQLYNRWCYSLNPAIHKGRFTKEEDILILAGIKKFGKDFSQISQFLHGRTSVQVRDRYNTIVQYMKPSGPWTEEEDVLLLQLVKSYGQGNWSKISQHFTNRNRTQIRHHYSTMQKWIMNNPGRSLRSINKRRNNPDTGPEKMWEGVRTVIRKKKIECTETKEELEVDMNLLELKQKLGLGGKKRGRKMGQKKMQGVLDRQYIHFFRCAYMQRGGRRKVRYDELHVKNRAQEMGLMFDSLKAAPHVPPDNVLLRDESLSQMDKYVLQSLRDKQSGLDKTQLPSPQISFYIPPNHTTILGFRTLLLSHSNLTEDMDYGNQSIFCDTKHGDHKAVALWKQRFESLFKWASLTFSKGPTMLADIFPGVVCPIASELDLEDVILPKRPKLEESLSKKEESGGPSNPQKDNKSEETGKPSGRPCTPQKDNKSEETRKRARNLRNVRRVWYHE